MTACRNSQRRVTLEFQFIICRIPDNSWSTWAVLMFNQGMALKSKFMLPAWLKHSVPLATKG